MDEKIRIVLKNQLKSIKEIVEESGNAGPEKEIGETLNAYRTRFLNSLDENEREIMDDLIRPLKIKKDKKWLDKNIVLMLCKQLIDLNSVSR